LAVRNLWIGGWESGTGPPSPGDDPTRPEGGRKEAPDAMHAPLDRIAFVWVGWAPGHGCGLPRRAHAPDRRRSFHFRFRSPQPQHKAATVPTPRCWRGSAFHGGGAPGGVRACGAPTAPSLDGETAVDLAAIADRVRAFSLVPGHAAGAPRRHVILASVHAAVNGRLSLLSRRPRGRRKEGRRRWIWSSLFTWFRHVRKPVQVPHVQICSCSRGVRSRAGSFSSVLTSCAVHLHSVQFNLAF
jgi:hypothetical protein